MPDIRAPRSRSALVVVALAAMVAVAGVAPVSAAFTPTKGKIKKIATKMAKKQVKKLTPGIAAETDGRVAFAYNPDTVIPVAPGAFIPLATTTVTAPTAGFLIVHGRSQMEMVVPADIWACDLTLDGLEIDSSLVVDFSVVEAEQGDDSNSDTEADIFVGNVLETCSTHAVVPVTAGVHGVTLRGAVLVAPEEFSDAYLSAEFVPFDGNGAPPTSFVLLTRSGSSDAFAETAGRYAARFDLDTTSGW